MVGLLTCYENEEPVSLFVSQRGERVAVATRGQITILRKEDDFREPFGVFSKCIDKFGPTEDATKALIACGLQETSQFCFSRIDDDASSQIWDFRVARLWLLQFRDRLETYMGINMGRFSVQEYSKFHVVPLSEAAITLAEREKIGALNLLFKLHPYSLSSAMLQVLAALPETIPV